MSEYDENPSEPVGIRQNLRDLWDAFFEFAVEEISGLVVGIFAIFVASALLIVLFG